MSSHLSLEVTPAHGRLDSWKEIAAYLRRSVRTVRRWEEKEGLPVHRLAHEKRGSVYAYQVELDEWRSSRTELVEREDAETGVIQEPTPLIRQRRLWPWLIGIAALGAAILALALVRTRMTNPPLIHSIAVLPFDNISHNPDDEWFSDGMTDALITELSQVQSLKVISRTSVLRYKGGTTPLMKIAKELGADAIVEGSALRVGDRVRVTAQLIAASTDTHLWSNSFDEDMKDVLALHREVARRIVDQVGAAVTRAEGQRLHERPGSENPQAVAAYMRGLYMLNRNADLRGALDLAREAVRTDDTLARAHALVASVLLTQAAYHQILHSAVLPEARAELDRALALDPGLPMALTQLGTEYFEAEHDWVRGEQALRKAFERDPSTGALYAYLLAAQGRNREAVEAADKSLVYDPANPLNLTDVAHIHLLVRQYEQAVEMLRKALDLSPDFGYARFYFPLALRLAGKPDEAFQTWISHPDGGKTLSPHLDEFRETYRGEGWPGVWKLYLRVAPTSSLNGRLRAQLFLNHKAEALSLLEELERQTDSWLVQLEDPIYDPLRKEPRFQAILKRVGYPQAMWQ